MVYKDTKANNGICRMTTSPVLASYRAATFQIGIPFGSPFLDFINA